MLHAVTKVAQMSKINQNIKLQSFIGNLKYIKKIIE